VHLPTNAALLIIDVQDAVHVPVWGERNNPEAEAHIEALLDAWRETGRPVLHVKHNSRSLTSPFHASHPGNAIQAFASPQPGEPLVEKDVNSAFIGTDLEDRLRDAGITTLVIVGFVTNHCVETTARMAGNLDFDTYVVADATATFEREGPDGRRYPADLVHAVSLASIHDEFVTVVDTATVLASVRAGGGRSGMKCGTARAAQPVQED
jgi:nicotinamidase-related amidase